MIGVQDWFPEAQISDQPIEKPRLSYSPFSFSAVDSTGEAGLSSVKSSWLPF